MAPGNPAVTMRAASLGEGGAGPRRPVPGAQEPVGSQREGETNSHHGNWFELDFKFPVTVPKPPFLSGCLGLSPECPRLRTGPGPAARQVPTLQVGAEAWGSCTRAGGHAPRTRRGEDSDGVHWARTMDSDPPLLCLGRGDHSSPGGRRHGERPAGAPSPGGWLPRLLSEADGEGGREWGMVGDDGSPGLQPGGGHLGAASPEGSLEEAVTLRPDLRGV